MRELGDEAPELACLLLVRNGERDLPEYLESVAAFADAVVALDDGSTDATSEILDQHPLVKVRLFNPRSEGRSGCGGSESRNRLLDAASSLRPRWILSLDVDERIPPDDARALRAFLLDGALRGAAYGFQVDAAAEPRDTDEDESSIFRLFSHRSGQRFRLLRQPSLLVPTDIPREHWMKTTLRIRKGSGNAGAARPSDLGVLDPSAHEQPPPARVDLQRMFEQPLAATRPALSAIVISQNDRGRIEEVMDALVGQEVDQPVEFILVNSGRDGTAEFVRERYSQVRVVHLPEPALPGKARNAGLKIATADYVTFPGSHIILPQGALQQRLDAHQRGYAMVCGSMTNGTDTRAGWASYFLDHAVALTGRPSRVLRLAPARCSYAKAPLAAIGGFPEDRRVGEDTVVNNRLFELGYRAYYSNKLQCVHKSPCTTTALLLRHHFERGFGFGRILWEQAGEPPRLRARLGTIAWLLTKYPVRRTKFITEAVRDWGQSVRREFVLSFPLLLAGVASAAVGAVVFLLKPQPADARAPLAVRKDHPVGS